MLRLPEDDGTAVEDVPEHVVPHDYNYEEEVAALEAAYLEISRLQKEANYVEDIEGAVQSYNGVNQQVAKVVASLESKNFHFDFEKYPIESFTKIPTSTNLAELQVSIENWKAVGIGALIAAILGALVKLGMVIRNRFFGGKGKKGKMSKDDNAKTSAESTSEKVDKAVKELDEILKDPKEIEVTDLFESEPGFSGYLASYIRKNGENRGGKLIDEMAALFYNVLGDDNKPVLKQINDLLGDASDAAKKNDVAAIKAAHEKMKKLVDNNSWFNRGLASLRLKKIEEPSLDKALSELNTSIKTYVEDKLKPLRDKPFFENASKIQAKDVLALLKEIQTGLDDFAKNQRQKYEDKVEARFTKERESIETELKKLEDVHKKANEETQKALSPVIAFVSTTNNQIGNLLLTSGNPVVWVAEELDAFGRWVDGVPNKIKSLVKKEGE